MTLKAKQRLSAGQWGLIGLEKLAGEQGGCVRNSDKILTKSDKKLVLSKALVGLTSLKDSISNSARLLQNSLLEKSFFKGVGLCQE